MDIAEAQTLIDGDDARLLKGQLVAIFGQMIGLRKSWQKSIVQETRATYGENSGFHHERLDAYQLALQVIGKCTAKPERFGAFHGTTPHPDPLPPGEREDSGHRIVPDA